MSAPFKVGDWVRLGESDVIRLIQAIRTGSAFTLDVGDKSPSGNANHWSPGAVTRVSVKEHKRPRKLTLSAGLAWLGAEYVLGRVGRAEDADYAVYTTDDEWTIVGSGSTPFEAIAKARKARGVRSPMKNARMP